MILIFCFLFNFLNENNLVFGQLNMNSFFSKNMILVIYLKNSSSDTVYFPNNYYDINLIFSNKNIYKSINSSIKYAYPETEVSDTTNLSLVHNCINDLKNINITKIPKGDSAKILYDLNQNHYVGFRKNKLYKYELNMYVSDEIKKFCPLIYSGKIKCEGEIFIINEN